MAHLAAPAPQPGDEDLPAAVRRSDMTPVSRPEHQPLGARRARRTGELHLPSGCHVRIDRQRARPYHGHGRHRLGSLPATVHKRRRGGTPHVPTETPKIMACAGTARQTHRQTAQPKTREGCSGSQAVNKWASREDSAAEKRRGFLRLLITRAFEDSHGTYGHRRVWAQLARWGVQAGLELVRRLMRELGMVPCQPRPWRATTSATAAFTCRLAVQRASRLNRPDWRRLMQTYGPLVGQPYFVT